MKTRHYWQTMLYRCDSGEFEQTVYLEDGCEGPRDVVDRQFRAFTKDGRDVLPVPMFAFRCPQGHHMSHIDWHLDREVDVPENQLPRGAWRFLYPSRRDRRRMRDRACGIPTPAVVA